MEEKWKVALYLRLSKEDGDKDESDSISSQRLLASRYVAQSMQDGEIVREFIDDGYTGTNFDRPKFQEMIRCIEKGEVNCVVVKDLSRFGRDYIGVGEYLEKYFPVKDVRFIAVNDGYDTLSENSSDEFVMPIKNIFNAQYSKDISKKVKSSFRSLQNDGKFVGAFASYGYVKDPKDRHKLLIDEPAAKIVREIFSMYNSGLGKVSIARRLNERSIPCPSEYKKFNGMNYTNGQREDLTKYWTYSTINHILHNEMYVGNMVQNRSVRKTVRGRAKKNDRDHWIVVSGTHEPIISEETWEITRNLLQRNTRQLDFEQNVGVFAGYIFCGNCGRAMCKIHNKYKSKVVTTYICGSYKRYGEKICRRNAVKLDFLEQLVLDKLNEQIKKTGEIEYGEEQGGKSREVNLKRYEISLEKCRRLKKCLYEDYREGILTKEEYLQYKRDYEEEEKMLLGQIGAVRESSKEEARERNRWIEILLKHQNIDSLDRETVAEVLDKIVVTGDDEGLNVDIVFKFALM